jgi:hypothetical protein
LPHGAANGRLARFVISRRSWFHGAVISRGDEYPLHQSSRPVRDPGTDRNLYDRFFFNGYTRTYESKGVSFFAVAFGTYPGRNVVDAAFSVIVDGVQHNVRSSRIMGDDRLDLTCGPVTIEIVEPLHQLRVRVDAPEAGISANLLFTSRAPAFEEPHFRFTPGNRTVMDITRMTQNGTWSGTLTTASGTIAITDDEWWGCRDRSWGIRPVGQREEPGAPDGFHGMGYYWLWAPMNFADQAVLFDVNEYPDGSRWHANAAVAPIGGTSADIHEGTHTYDIEWKPNTRHATAFAVDMAINGVAERYELTSLLTFYMSGIGYGHPTWGHGHWVGPDERTHDSLVLADADETKPLLQHVQILSNVRRVSDGAIGSGVLEMLLVGPHAPSGFREPLDMHA